MNLKFENTENEMDIRVESLIANIYEYRDECKNKLNKIREDLKKLFFLIIISVPIS